MERRPLLSFIVLIILGPLLIVVGVELLDFSNTASTVSRTVGLWVPAGLMLAGAGMVFAAVRLLRFVALGMMLVVGGINFMWLAPSLRPFAGALVGGLFQMVESLIVNDGTWQTIVSDYARNVSHAFADSSAFGQDQIAQDLVFICGGLFLVITGVGLVVWRGSRRPIKVEIHEGLGVRRTTIVVPVESDPKVVEATLKGLGQSSSTTPTRPRSSQPAGAPTNHRHRRN